MEKNNPLICCLCNHKFQHPKILACLHSFCLVCLQGLQSNSKWEERTQCPLCHQTSELTKKGLAGLKTNFFLSRLVSESTLLQTLQSAKVPCGLCSSETAESRCFDCTLFLCQVCRKFHNGIPSTFDHEMLSLEESRKVFLRDVNNPTPARLVKPQDDALECPKHPKEKSRFFCQTCDVLICRDCTVIDHPAPSHSYTSLDEAAADKRESAKNMMARLKMKIPDADDLLQALKTMGSKFKRHADRARKDVKTQAQLNRDLVNAEETRLLREIRQENQKQMKQLKEAEVKVKVMLRHMHNSLQSGGVFVEGSTDSEFLWLYFTLKKDLDHLEQLQLPLGPSALSFMSTEPDVSLGELQKSDTAEMITEEVAQILKLKENNKLQYSKIGTSSSASSSESSQPHAPKETDVLKKQGPELKQQTSDSSRCSPDSDAENITSSAQLSKTSTLLEPFSQPTGKPTEKISSQQSAGPKHSTSAKPGRKIDIPSLSIPTSKQTEKISSQQPNNSSGLKPSTYAAPGRKIDTNALSMSNVNKQTSNQTVKQTEKISSQEPNDSTAPIPSKSAGPGGKIYTISLPMSNINKQTSNPTVKQTEKISSQEPNDSTAPIPSKSAGPGGKIDTNSLPMSNVPKQSSYPISKQTEKIYSTAPKPSTPTAAPGRKIDTTSLSMSNVPKPTSNPSGKQTENYSSQQPDSSSVPKPSTAGARPKNPLPGSDRVLRSSTKLTAINESKGEERRRQEFKTRTNQPHFQPSNSNGKATANKITSPHDRKLHSLQSNPSNKEIVTSALQPKGPSVKSGKSKQKAGEEDSVDSQMDGVQGASLEKSQRQDETDSACPKEDRPQGFPAQDDKSKSGQPLISHGWFSEDIDSDDSDL